MDARLDLMGDSFGKIPRAMSKKIARDMRGYFAVQECLVGAVISTFYMEFWRAESTEGRGYSAPP